LHYSLYFQGPEAHTLASYHALSAQTKIRTIGKMRTHRFFLLRLSLFQKYLGEPEGRGSAPSSLFENYQQIFDENLPHALSMRGSQDPFTHSTRHATYPHDHNSV
jgi:hypothetical protein